jgi:hypothetical protein
VAGRAGAPGASIAAVLPSSDPASILPAVHRRCPLYPGAGNAVSATVSQNEAGPLAGGPAGDAPKVIFMEPSRIDW